MEELESINRIFDTYICATCLADDRDLFYLDQQQRTLLVTLGIKVTNDQKTCWECYARIRNIMRFQLTARYAHLVHKKRKMKQLEAVGSMSRLKKTNAFTLYTISELKEAVIITEDIPSSSLSSFKRRANLNKEHRQEMSKGLKVKYPVYIFPDVSNKKSYITERNVGYFRPLSRTKIPKAEFTSPTSSRKNTYALHKQNLLRNRPHKQSIALAKKQKKKKSKNNTINFVDISMVDNSKDPKTGKDAVNKDMTVPPDDVDNTHCNAARQLCNKEIEKSEDSVAVERSIIKENITDPLSDLQNILDKTLQTITANADDESSQTQHNVAEVEAVAKNLIKNNVNNYLTYVDNRVENNLQTVPANKYENNSDTEPNNIDLKAVENSIKPNNITGTLTYGQNIVEHTTITINTDENISQIELNIPELEAVVNRITQNDVPHTLINKDNQIENFDEVFAGISDENTCETKLGEHSQNLDEYNLQTITASKKENTTPIKTKDVLLEMGEKSVIQIDINDTQKSSENIFEKCLHTVTDVNISLTECKVPKLEAVPNHKIQNQVADILNSFHVIAVNAGNNTAHTKFYDPQSANQDGKTSQTTPYNKEIEFVAKTMTQDNINNTPPNTQYIIKNNANAGENTLRNETNLELEAVANIILRNYDTDTISDLENNCTLQNVTYVNKSQTKLDDPEVDLQTAKEKVRSDNNLIENDNGVLHFDKTYNLSNSTTIDDRKNVNASTDVNTAQTKLNNPEVDLQTELEKGKSDINIIEYDNAVLHFHKTYSLCNSTTIDKSKKYTITDKKIISQSESCALDNDENFSLESVKQIKTNEVTRTNETDAHIDIKGKNTGNTVNDENVEEGIVMNTKQNISCTSRHKKYTRGTNNLFSGRKKYFIIDDGQRDSYIPKDSSSFTKLNHLHNINANNIDMTHEVNENPVKNKCQNFMITDQASSETTKLVNQTCGKKEVVVPNGNISFTQVGKYPNPEKTHFKTIRKERNQYESVNYLSKRNKNSLLKPNFGTPQNSRTQLKKFLIPGVLFNMLPEKKIGSKKECTDWAVTELNKSIVKTKNEMKKKAFIKDSSKKHDDDEADNCYQNISLLCSEEINISNDSNFSTDGIITLSNETQKLYSNSVNSANFVGNVRDEDRKGNAPVGTDFFTVTEKIVALSGVETFTGTEGKDVVMKLKKGTKNREPNKCTSVEEDKTKMSKIINYNYGTGNYNAGNNVCSKNLTLKSKQNSACVTLGVKNKNIMGGKENNTLFLEGKNNISTCLDKNNTLANEDQDLGHLDKYDNFTILNYNAPSVTTKGNDTYVTPTGAHNAAQLSALNYIPISDNINVPVANDTQNIPIAYDERKKIQKFNVSVIKEARLEVDDLTDQTKKDKKENHISQNILKAGDDRNKILKFNIKVIEEAKMLDVGLTDQHTNNKKDNPVLYHPDFSKKYNNGSDLLVASLFTPEIPQNKNIFPEKVKGAQELVVHRVTDDRSSRLALKINILDQYTSNDINIPIHMIENKSTIAPPIEDDYLCRPKKRNTFTINKLTDNSQIIRCKPAIKKSNASKSKPVISEAFKTVLMDHCYNIYSKKWLFEFYKQKQDPKVLHYKIVQNSMGKIRFLKTSSIKRNKSKLDQSHIVQEIIDDFEKEEAVAGVSCPSEKEYINKAARKNMISNESSTHNNKDLNIMVEADDYSILTDIKVEECNLESYHENNECDESFDWCIQSCQKEKVDTNPGTIFRTSYSPIDLDFNGSMTDTASEGGFTNMSSETGFENYYETDEYEDNNEIADTENLESGYNYYQIKPSEYDNYVPPRNYDNDSYEVEPSKETGLYPSDFEMNNITISFPYSIFDDIPKNISVKSPDEINNDVNSAAINIQNSDIRNTSPNLLEARFFTTYKDSTYEHVMKSRENETGDNKKPEYETHENKVRSTGVQSESKLKVTNESKKKRKLSHLVPHKNDRTLRSGRSVKSGNSKKILRVVVERLKLDTEKDEGNQHQGINIEKLLQCPIVLLEKIIVDEQHGKVKTSEDKDNNKIKEPLLSEFCNSFVGNDETCISQRNAVEKPLRLENKKYASRDLIQVSIPRKVPKAADQYTYKTSDSDELKSKVLTTKQTRRALGRSDQVTKSEIDHHRTVKKCLNMKIKANEDGLLPGTPADVFFLRLIPENEIKSFRRNFSLKDKFKKCFYRCNKCIMGFKKVTHLLNHCKKFHEVSAGTFICNICECRFKTEDKLKYHTESHKSVYRCRWCTEEYLYFFGLLTHVRHFHSDERKSYSCKLCHKKYYNSVSLWTHVKTHNFSTVERVTRYKNLRSTHNNLNSNDGMAFSTGDDLCSNGDDLCSNGDDLCSAGDKLSVEDDDTCTTDGDLVNTNATDANMSVHDDSIRQLNKCDICGKVFQHRSLLVKHKRHHKPAVSTTMAKKKLHKCEICRREFRRMSSLTNHRKTHITWHPNSLLKNQQNNRNYPGITFKNEFWPCKECDNAYSSANLLKQHKHRYHNTKNIIKNSTLSIESNLSSTDLDLTTTDNNLSSIDNNASLADSVKEKLKSKLHKCEICRREFRLMSSLTNHRKSHETWHGKSLLKYLKSNRKFPGINFQNKVWSCKECHNMYSSANSLKKHRYMYHKTENIKNRKISIDNNLSPTDLYLTTTDNNLSSIDNNASLADSVKEKRKRSPHKMCKLCPTECTAQDSLWGHGMLETENTDINPHIFEHNTTDNNLNKDNNLSDNNLMSTDNNLSSTDNNLNDNNLSLTGNNSSLVDNNLSYIDNNLSLTNDNVSVTENVQQNSATDHVIISNKNHNEGLKLINNKHTLALKIKGRKRSRISLDVCSTKNDIQVSLGERDKIMHKIAYSDGKPNRIKRSLSLANSSFSLTDKNVMSTDNNLSSVDNNLSSTDYNLSPPDNNLNSTDINFKSTDNDLKSTDNNLSLTDKCLSSPDEELSSNVNIFSPTDNNLSLTDNNVSLIEYKLNVPEMNMSVPNVNVSVIEDVEQSQPATENVCESATSDEKLINSYEFDKSLRANIKRKRKCKKNLKRHCRCVTQTEHQNKDNKTERTNDRTETTLCVNDLSSTENVQSQSVAGTGNDEVKDIDNISNKKGGVEVKRKSLLYTCKICQKQFRRSSKDSIKKHKIMHKTADAKSAAKFNLTDSKLNLPDVYSKSTRRSQRVKGTSNKKTVIDFINLSSRGKEIISYRIQHLEIQTKRKLSCKVCRKLFSNDIELAVHMSDKHTTEDIFESGRSTVNMTKQGGFKSFSSVSMPGGLPDVNPQSEMNTSETCQMKFRSSSKYSILKHNIMHQNVKSEIRSISDKKYDLTNTFLSSTQRSQQVRENVNESTDIPGTDFSLYGNEGSSQKTVHLEMESKRKLMCQFCYKLYENKEQITAHISDEHKEPTTLKCGRLRDTNLSLNFSNLSLTESDISLTDNNMSLTGKNISLTDKNISLTDNNLSLPNNQVSFPNKNINITDNDITMVADQSGPMSNNLSLIDVKSSLTHGLGELEKDSNEILNKLSSVEDNSGGKNLDLTDNTVHFTKNEVSLVDNSTYLGSTDDNNGSTENASSFTVSADDKSSKNNILNLLKEENNLNSTKEKMSLFADSISCLASTDANKDSIDDNKGLIDDNISLSENDSIFSVSSDDNISSNNFNFNLTEDSSSTQEMNFTTNNLGLFANNSCYLASTDDNKGSRDENVRLMEKDSNFSVSTEKVIISENINIIAQTQSLQENNLNLLENTSVSTQKLGATDDSLKGNNLSLKDDNSSLKDKNLRSNENSLSLQQNNINLLENYFKSFERPSATNDV